MVLGCRFKPGLSASDSNLKVTWHWISSTSSREVYRLDNGVEQPAYQDPVYLGRATLLREELENNWAKLKVPGPGPGRASSIRVQVMLFWSQQVLSSGSSHQISDLRIGDSGTYQCLVQIGEEADYKEVLLSVTGDDPLLVFVFFSLKRGHFWSSLSNNETKTQMLPNVDLPGTAASSLWHQNHGLNCRHL